MKKMVLFFILMVLVVSSLLSDVFITELADPNNAAGARYVEFYNNGAEDVDFSTGWQIQRATNGNTYWATAVNLTGTITAGDFYIICANQTTFTSTYGFAADQQLGTGGPADSNGDDQLRLLSPGEVVEDMFGVLGEDGSGTNHEFEDGRAERQGTVTSGNTTYTFSEWNIWNDTGAAGTTNDPQDAPADFDPGAWIGTGGNLLPSISNITHTPSNDITSSTTVSVSAEVTDPDGSLTNVELHWGTTSGSLTNTINMSILERASYTTDSNIPVQADGVTVYYEIQATDDEPESTTSSEQSYTVFDAQTTTIPYLEDFAADLGECYTYSVSGATKEWYWNSSGYAACNGYNSGDVEEDWLIFPGIDFDSYANEIMTFETMYNYNSINTDNYLKLYYSADYTGLGNPSSSTWTELSYTQPAATSTWTESGNIDLSGVSGSAVYIAFKYRGISGGYNQWSVDNISIAEVANLAPEISSISHSPSSNIGTSTTVSVSADVIDSDGTITSVELHWGTTSGSLGTTISMTNTTDETYVTDSNIPVQSEGTTVYYEIYAVDNGSESTTSSEYSYFVTDAIAPEAGDLIINEVCGDGAGGGSDDGFMEIYNSSSSIISLANVQARYFNSNPGNPTQTVDLSGTMAAGAYIIVTQNETNFNATYAPITADYSGSAFYFNGGDDGLDVYHSINGIIDQFNDNGTGASPWTWSQNVFERNTTGSGAVFENWTEITEGIGSPGEENPISSLDTPTNVVISHNGTNVSITWGAVTGANSYIIYSCDTPDGTYVSVDYVDTNSWTNAEASAKKFYKVEASTEAVPE